LRRGIEFPLIFGTNSHLCGSALMPEVRNDSIVCFVQGHGVLFNSGRKTICSAETETQNSVSPLTLESVRQRAAAQLAIQQVASRTLIRK
jgi:hypothetical protein